MYNEKIAVAEQSVQNLKEASKKVHVGNPGTINNMGLLELEVESGHAISAGIFKSGDIAIAETFACEGTIFAPHLHTAIREVIQIVKGSMQIWLHELDNHVPVRDADYDLGKYDAVIIEPNVPHLVLITSDTKFIASTMPAESNFPDARIK